MYQTGSHYCMKSCGSVISAQNGLQIELTETFLMPLVAFIIDSVFGL